MIAAARIETPFAEACDRFILHAGAVAMESAWKRMACASVATPFQRWRWLGSLCGRAAASGGGCFALEWRSGECREPLLLLPLQRMTRRGVSTIEFIDGGASDYNAPAIREGARIDAARMRLAWRGIRAALPHADVISLTKLPGRLNGLVNPLTELPRARRMRFGAWGVPLPGSFDELQITSFAQPFGRKMAERWRKLVKAGGATFRVADTPAAIEGVFAELVRQRARRHQALGRDDILADPGWRSHYRGLLEPGPGGDRACAVLVYLCAGDAIIATGYGLRHAQAFHMILTSFEAETWRNYSPGIQLFRMAMKWAIAERLSYFDFTIGDEPYKREFGAREAPLFELTEGLTPVGLAVELAGDLRRRLRQALRGGARRSAAEARPTR